MSVKKLESFNNSFYGYPKPLIDLAAIIYKDKEQDPEAFFESIHPGEMWKPIQVPFSEMFAFAKMYHTACKLYEEPSDIEDIVHNMIIEQCRNNVERYGDFNSFHEAYAVILEELDELWSEIKQKQPNGTKVMNEAIDVAACAMRFAIEVYTRIDETARETGLCPND